MAMRKRRPDNLTVYLMRDNYAFIQDPAFHGKWLRVEKCVALYGCPVCDSKTGVPCRTPDGESWSTQSHFQRRRRSTRLPPDFSGVTVVESWTT